MARNEGIYQLPSGRWQVKTTVPATRTEPARRVSRTAPTQAAARALRREMLAEVRELGDRANEVLRPRAGVLVRDYVQGPFAAVLAADVASGRIRPRTAEDYLAVCVLRIVPLFGHRRVSTLVATDGDLLAARVAGQGLASSTARRAVVTLVRLLRAAERDGLVRAGIADAVRLPSGQAEGDPERLSADEARLLIKTVLEDCRAGRAAEAPLAALIMIFTGVRRSEVLGLRWCDVDLEAGTARIRQGITELADGTIVVDDTKSKHAHRTVHLPPVVVEQLAGMERGADQDRICGTRPSILSRYVRDAGLRALDRTVGTHEARRAYADLALDAGVDPFVVSRSLGHSDVRLLHRVYAGRREADVLAAGAAVGKLLG